MVASLFGAGMWAVAMVYEVMALGGDPIALSIVGTATSLGLITTALLGGVAADRLPKRAILRAVEGCNALGIAVTALLSALGLIEVWHLAVTGTMLGAAAGFFFPAYSAILPRILPADELLAANGIEGVGRPVLQYAAGPAAAGALVAAFSPGDAIAWIAGCHALAFASLWWLHPRVDAAPTAEADAQGGRASPPTAEMAVVTPPVRMGFLRATVSGIRATFASMWEGITYTASTGWLRWTLVWAIVVVFLFVGPFEVLTPFVLRDQHALGADAFGFLLAANGAGSAIGALVVASRPMPRRYLSSMLFAWGCSCLPLAVIGIAPAFWMLLIAAALIGAGGGMGQVIWGTLLQRRVPPEMLGRVSSLDFFVSLALMPLSMALTGPLVLLVPPSVIFLAVGLGIPVLTLLAWWRGRFAHEELEHPLPSGD